MPIRQLGPICPVCGSQEGKIREDIPAPYNVTTWRQCFCGISYQITDVTMEQMAEYYRREYREIATVVEGEYPRPWDIAVQISRTQRQLQTFGYCKPDQPRRIIDIGCANGVFLDTCRMLWNCEVVGVEFNERDHELLEARNIPWYNDIDDAPGKFDLILMSHVLEHFDRPVEFLQKLADQKAMPRGWLLIELPKPEASTAYGRWHYVVFPSEGLLRTLTLGGWVVKHMIDINETVQQAVARLP